MFSGPELPFMPNFHLLLPHRYHRPVCRGIHDPVDRHRRHCLGRPDSREIPLWMGLSVRIGPRASLQGSVREVQHPPMDEIHQIWGVPRTGRRRAILPEHRVFPLFLPSLPCGYHSVIDTLGDLGGDHQYHTSSDSLGYTLRHHCSCHGPSALLL